MHRLAEVNDVRVDVVAGSLKVRNTPDTLNTGELHSAVRDHEYPSVMKAPADTRSSLRECAA